MILFKYQKSNSIFSMNNAQEVPQNKGAVALTGAQVGGCAVRVLSAKKYGKLINRNLGINAR